jgi:uncharacterized membrane protein
MVSSGKGSDPVTATAPALLKAWESLFRVAQALKPENEALRALRMPTNPSWAEALSAGRTIEDIFSTTAPVVQFCTQCGKPLPENAYHCPGCGTAATGGAVTTGSAASTPAGGLPENVAGLLAYVTIIPAIIFLVLEPYNRSRFIRFHAFQSIFFYLAWMVLGIALSVIGAIPFLGWALLLLWPLIGLGGLLLWVLLLVKAYDGQMWKLPVIGDMAEKQAGVPTDSVGGAPVASPSSRPAAGAVRECYRCARQIPSGSGYLMQGQPPDWMKALPGGIAANSSKFGISCEPAADGNPLVLWFWMCGCDASRVTPQGHENARTFWDTGKPPLAEPL